MHIVIAVITAIAGLFWALNALQRSGFQFSSLNPFLAWRRFQWSRTYGGRPIYKLERPMDVAAVLLLGIAKADGAITSDQKRELLAMFQSEFSISRDEASDLLLASSHLIRDEIYLVDHLGQDPGAQRGALRARHRDFAAGDDAQGRGAGRFDQCRAAEADRCHRALLLRPESTPGQVGMRRMSALKRDLQPIHRRRL